jgi:hypothetical protein
MMKREKATHSESCRHHAVQLARNVLAVKPPPVSRHVVRPTVADSDIHMFIELLQKRKVSHAVTVEHATLCLT